MANATQSRYANTLGTRRIDNNAWVFIVHLTFKGTGRVLKTCFHVNNTEF